MDPMGIQLTYHKSTIRSPAVRSQLSACHLLARMGSLAVCRALLDAGANVEMADRDGCLSLKTYPLVMSK